nr:hypothetical protein Iba_chr04dCG13590 [Ipomoea batatas]
MISQDAATACLLLTWSAASVNIYGNPARFRLIPVKDRASLFPKLSSEYRVAVESYVNFHASAQLRVPSHLHQSIYPPLTLTTKTLVVVVLVVAKKLTVTTRRIGGGAATGCTGGDEATGGCEPAAALRKITAKGNSRGSFCRQFKSFSI